MSRLRTTKLKGELQGLIKLKMQNSDLGGVTWKGLLERRGMKTGK